MPTSTVDDFCTNEVYLNPNGIANVLSLNLLGKKHHITYDSRGCTQEFSHAKAEKKFWFHVRNKKRSQKKYQEAQFVPPPKSRISTFDDGGQYSSVIIISRS